MRDAATVVVERAIVHKIDHIGPDTTLSEIELDLDANPALRDYFSKQAANALGDEGTRAARFVIGEKNQDARLECLRILQDEERFVASSQALAKLLRQAMAGNNSIAPGSLAVCIYTASNYPGMQFLALIKLDPNRALVQTITTEKGKKLVSFDIQTEVMPTEREPLQKAALIPSAAVDAKYDLLLLDRQGAKPAEFFATAFLNTTVAFDAKNTTERLYYALENSRKEANLTLAETFAVKDWLPGVIRSERPTVSGLVKSLPLPKEKKAVYRKEIRKMLPGEERLDLDPEFADKLLRKSRFRGGYGVRFEVLTEFLKKVVISEKQRTEKGKSITRVTLDVPDLEWVK